MISQLKTTSWSTYSLERAFSGSDQAIHSISIEDEDKAPFNTFQIEIEDAAGEKTTKITSWPTLTETWRSGPAFACWCHFSTEVYEDHLEDDIKPVLTKNVWKKVLRDRQQNTKFEWRKYCY